MSRHSMVHRVRALGFARSAQRHPAQMSSPAARFGDARICRLGIARSPIAASLGVLRRLALHEVELEVGVHVRARASETPLKRDSISGRGT